MVSIAPTDRRRSLARWLAFLGAFLAVFGCDAIGRYAWRSTAHQDRSYHEFGLSFFHGMDPDEAQEYAARSARIRAHAAEDGEDVSSTVVRGVGAEEVSDDEIRSSYLAHGEMFGTRPLTDAAPGIRRILQIRKARERFESAEDGLAGD